jgi:hypothetical protein
VFPKEIQKANQQGHNLCFFLLLPALPVSWIHDGTQKAIVASNIGWATEVIDDR